jgi:cephalosporin-C deacetylase
LDFFAILFCFLDYPYKIFIFFECHPMPAMDKPLELLRQYQGSSPCPADIDSYWDQSLAMLDTIDSKLQLVPSKFQVPFAECFDLTFSGFGGARVYAKYLRPKNSVKPHPAVLQFHGYSGNSGDWNDKLNYVAAGFSVAALDCRGQGGKSQDSSSVLGTTFKGQIVRGLEGGPDQLLFRKHFLDTAQLARLVMAFEEVDEKRVAAMGGSQGGGLTLACASLEPRINRCAPVFPFLSDYKRVWDMDLAKNAYEELRLYFRQFDPLHERENEIFEILGYIDIQNIVKRIQGKALMGISLMDEICPASTQFAAYNKITSQKDCVIYPDFGHENLPGFQDKVFSFMMEML